MQHIGTHVLQTSRLVLRSFTVDDAQAMFQNWASDPRVTEYLTWGPHESVQQTAALLTEWCARYTDNSTYKWLIEYQSVPIGGIDVVRQNEPEQTAELGYCIGFDYWGHGFVPEALKAVLVVLFEQAGFRRVTLRHDVGNPASGRVAEKCGFRFDRIQPNGHTYADGRSADLMWWTLNRGDWRRMQGGEQR